jgi:hypothetical protein
LDHNGSFKLWVPQASTQEWTKLCQVVDSQLPHNRSGPRGKFKAKPSTTVACPPVNRITAFFKNTSLSLSQNHHSTQHSTAQHWPQQKIMDIPRSPTTTQTHYMWELHHTRPNQYARHWF